MKEGEGLVICRHHGRDYFGFSRDRSKGTVTKYRPVGTLDGAVDMAAHRCRLWRRRGWHLQSQVVKP